MHRGDMTLVVNFRDTATEVDAERELESVFTVGHASTAGGAVRLGPHSALVGRGIALEQA